MHAEASMEEAAEEPADELTGAPAEQSPEAADTVMQHSDGVDPAAIRRAAMDLLARREHSRKELQQKLSRRFGSAALGPDLEQKVEQKVGQKVGQKVEQELERLQAENLQSDARYAESFARQRMLRGYGPLRLRQEMRQKGIPDAQANLALEALDVDWFEQARAVCEKKFGAAAAADLKEKSRRQRFLQYRGFSQDHISACLQP
ncbi:regulatory protein RecX [Parahaliea mediterranea]|uniref:regulatory protein RecX n=1 Tax=Parahaliea mediterranea TaxID=651086 RepID=UPI001F4DB674|nr:regulatory protein RecX [Parahaliea mediterranea]